MQREKLEKLEKLEPKQKDWDWGKGIKTPDDWDFTAFKRKLIERENARIKITKEKT